MEKAIYTKRQKKLGALLRLARRKALLSQAALAEKLDKPQSFVSNYETGQRRLDVVELVAIAEVLGISASDVVAEVERRGMATKMLAF